MNIKIDFKCMLAVSICLIFCGIGCSSASQTKLQVAKNKLDASVGWLHGNCLAVKNSEIASGSDLVIVVPNTQETVHSKIVRKIVRKTNKANECYPLIEDRRTPNQ